MTVLPGSKGGRLCEDGSRRAKAVLAQRVPEPGPAVRKRSSWKPVDQPGVEGASGVMAQHI
jgi:hypothetical protein